MLVMSFHSTQGKPYTLHKALHCKSLSVDLTQVNWRQFLHGLVSALCHIHDKGNDIKSDNVVLDGDGLYIRGVLIDFGKGCLVKNGKSYKLSESSKEYYTQYHPQIAPDLRNGHCQQSSLSDVYSFGRIIHQVNEHFHSSHPCLLCINVH